jgi:hypothetical protein
MSPLSVHNNPRFVPYARMDKYGLCGLKPQPTSERVRLLVMTVLVLPIRFLLAALCLVACNITFRVASVLPDGTRQVISAALGKLWCHLCLLCLGFFVRWVKVTHDQLDNYPVTDGSVKAVGIISNHCR